MSISSTKKISFLKFSFRYRFHTECLDCVWYPWPSLGPSTLLSLCSSISPKTSGGSTNPYLDTDPDGRHRRRTCRSDSKGVRKEGESWKGYVGIVKRKGQIRLALTYVSEVTVTLGIPWTRSGLRWNHSFRKRQGESTNDTLGIENFSEE